MTNNTTDPKGEIPAEELERINNDAIEFSENDFDPGDYRDTAYIAYKTGKEEEYLRHSSQPVELPASPSIVEPEVFRFVKCSDRMPMVPGEYVLRYANGELILGHFGRALLMIRLDTNRSIDKSVFEWLEKIPPTVEPAAETEEVQKLRGLLLEIGVRAGIFLPTEEWLIDLFDTGFEGCWGLFAHANEMLYDNFKEIQVQTRSHIQPEYRIEDGGFVEKHLKNVKSLRAEYKEKFPIPPSPPSVKTERDPLSCEWPGGKPGGCFFPHCDCYAKPSPAKPVASAPLSVEKKKSLDISFWTNIKGPEEIAELNKAFDDGFRIQEVNCGNVDKEDVEAQLHFCLLRSPSPLSAEREDDTLRNISDEFLKRANMAHGKGAEKGRFYSGLAEGLSQVVRYIESLRDDRRSTSPTNLPLEEGERKPITEVLGNIPIGEAAKIAKWVDAEFASLQSQLSVLREEMAELSGDNAHNIKRALEIAAARDAANSEKEEYRKALEMMEVTFKEQSIRRKTIRRLLDKYPSSSTPTPPVAEGEKERVIAFVNWFTGEKSQYAVMYGDQSERFCDNDLKEYTIAELYTLYLQSTNSQKH